MTAHAHDFDATHDPSRTSWVASANGHADFPIQNLPLGVFNPAGGAPRAGVAIGDDILDLGAVRAAGLLAGDALAAAEAAEGATLNALLALGAGPRTALRRRLSDLLRAGAAEQPAVAPALHAAAGCTVHLPAAIGDYTDFFTGIHHAVNAGRMFRPDQPLLPNYKHVPVGYHGRASSVRASGAPVRRPHGQLKPADAAEPHFAPSRRLDFELELGVWVGPGNEAGARVPIAAAPAHVAGFCLLNDWSARDIQAWEAQPLGPFLAKNFATTISPWIITLEAMAPFRAPQAPRPEGDPKPLDYLWDESDQAGGALALELEALLLTPGLRERGLPLHRLALSHSRHLYWTVAQMLAHHTSGGCDLRPGDLFGTGTISTPDATGCGSLLEITLGGRQPITLLSGETRAFLEDGDEIILSAHARRDGAVSIGFGPCRGIVVAAG